MPPNAPSTPVEGVPMLLLARAAVVPDSPVSVLGEVGAEPDEPVLEVISSALTVAMPRSMGLPISEPA